MASFVEQIRDRMKAKGWALADVAKEAGISRAYMYRIMDGSQTPSMEIADKIAAALGLVITTTPAK